MVPESKNDKSVLNGTVTDEALTEEVSSKADDESVAKPKENEKLSPKAEKETENVEDVDADEATDDEGNSEDSYESVPESVTSAGKSQGFGEKAKAKLDVSVAWLRKDVRRMIGVGVLAVCVIAMVIAGCVGGGSEGYNSGIKKAKGLSPELQALAEARTSLVVGISDRAYPPFVYERYGGGYGGSDVELMKEVCKVFGWKLELVPIDWSMRQEVLARGEVDCLWCGFNSYGREDVYAWTEPYKNMSDVIAVPKKGSGIKELSDLEGKTVAAVADSNPSRELEHIGLGMTRVSCKTIEECLEALNAKEVDAIAASAEDAVKIIQSVTLLEDPLEARLYAVAFQKDNTDLRDIVDYAIQKVYAEN